MYQMQSTKQHMDTTQLYVPGKTGNSTIGAVETGFSGSIVVDTTSPKIVSLIVTATFDCYFKYNIRLSNNNADRPCLKVTRFQYISTNTPIRQGKPAILAFSPPLCERMNENK